MRVSLHNHTTYCDGASTVEAMIHSALEKKINYFGISSHAPLKVKKYWTMNIEKLQEYINEIKQFKEKYSEEMQVLIGLEADYIPYLSYSFQYLKEQFHLDYVIGSVHVVKFRDNYWFIDGDREDYVNGIKEIFQGDVRSAIRAYFDQICEMIEKEKPDVLGHVDKILMHNQNEFFGVEDEVFLQGMQNVLEMVKKHEVIVEINTRGMYTGKYPDYYPGRYSWKWLKDHEIPIVVTSDAHKADEVLMEMDEAIKDLREFGFSEFTLPVKANRIKLSL